MKIKDIVIIGTIVGGGYLLYKQFIKPAAIATQNAANAETSVANTIKATSDGVTEIIKKITGTESAIENTINQTSTGISDFGGTFIDAAGKGTITRANDVIHTIEDSTLSGVKYLLGTTTAKSEITTQKSMASVAEIINFANAESQVANTLIKPSTTQAPSLLFGATYVSSPAAAEVQTVSIAPISNITAYKASIPSVVVVGGRSIPISSPLGALYAKGR